MNYQAGQAPAPRSNTGAIVAIVIGVVLFGCIIFTAVIAAFLFPVFAKSRERARQTQCMNNVRETSVAILMYSQDHSEQLPGKDIVWADVKFPPKALTCPTYGIDNGNGYGYNASLSKKLWADISDASTTPMLADSTAPGNLLNTVSDIDPRHSGSATVGYLDGHVAQQAPVDVRNLPAP